MRQNKNRQYCHYLFQFGLGYSADAVGAKVSVPCLDTAQTAQVLIALLLPFSNQILIGIALLDAEVVQL